MTFISPADPHIQYCGRVDFSDPSAPLFTWVCSSFRFILKGKRAVLHIRNERSYFDNCLGIVMNGFEGRLPLKAGEQQIDISAFLIDDVNDVLIYKRQDGCHRFALLGMEVEGGLADVPALPERRMEVYGDSVSCGEVCEAMHLVGQGDPEGHEGIYSNSWYCYGWQTARALGACLHNCSQGGIALQPGRGWFNDPYVGMLEIWDKMNYNENLGPRTRWDFTRFTPQVVIVALGQNDAHPGDFMADDPKGPLAAGWKADYMRFLGSLRAQYPRARIILTTTVLCHHPSWDKALDEIAEEMGKTDPRVLRFRFRRTGIATPGHPRVSEQNEMARELTAFISSLGDGIWND